MNSIEIPNSSLNFVWSSSLSTPYNSIIIMNRKLSMFPILH